VRPRDLPTEGIASGQWGSWRCATEFVAGAPLVHMALGRARQHLGASANDETTVEVDLGDMVAETSDDATGLFDLDDQQVNVDSGVLDPFGAVTNPVTALQSDPVTATRLARAIDALLLDTEGWNTVALLALLRVTLIVAAGGGT
jgi:hypothetical protein